jgi:hypothetical protein
MTSDPNFRPASPGGVGAHAVDAELLEELQMIRERV